MPDGSTPIVLATANPHKVEEMRAIFGAAGVGVIGLADLGTPTREPEEHGATFEENASIKARSYAAQTGRWCLADDSGLEIDALGGRPGVISSHYHSDGRETTPPTARVDRDRLNNERVLRELSGVPEKQRTARFVCVMALARPDGQIVAVTRGTFEGRIGMSPAVPRGANGFGYDPLFLVAPGFERTGAELSSDEKNARSHRASAAALMAEAIVQRRFM